MMHNDSDSRSDEVPEDTGPETGPIEDKDELYQLTSAQLRESPQDTQTGRPGLWLFITLILFMFAAARTFDLQSLLIILAVLLDARLRERLATQQ